MGAADVITSVSVTVAAIAFVTGVFAWKREFVGKRRIDLAESVLALFYEAEDAIREIRNPFSFGGEGNTRKRSEHEREEESHLLDEAYVVIERYQKREQLFAQLRSMKYRFMATCGAVAGEPFDELTKVLNEIFIAAQVLSRYWPRRGRGSMTPDAFQIMQSQEAVFWYMGDEKDAIGPRVRSAVQKVEAIANSAVITKVGLLDDITQSFRSLTRRS